MVNQSLWMKTVEYVFFSIWYRFNRIISWINTAADMQNIVNIKYKNLWKSINILFKSYILAFIQTIRKLTDLSAWIMFLRNINILTCSKSSNLIFYSRWFDQYL